MKTKVIYEPRGKAAEYCKLALNLYTGCTHGCKYCYAPQIRKMSPEKFHEVGLPRKNIIENIKWDSQWLGLEWNRPTSSILMCFMTDPYQPGINGTTREALKHLKDANLEVAILTKGRGCDRDMDLLDSADKFGVTLTLLDDEDSREWEPNAALPQERIENLKHAKSRGIGTWVSLEPVIDPEQTYEIIKQTAGMVDQYKVGVLNYHPRAREIDWTEFARRVVSELEAVGASYYLKDDLRKWLR